MRLLDVRNNTIQDIVDNTDYASTSNSHQLMDSPIQEGSSSPMEATTNTQEATLNELAIDTSPLIPKSTIIIPSLNTNSSTTAPCDTPLSQNYKDLSEHIYVDLPLSLPSSNQENDLITHPMIIRGKFKKIKSTSSSN